MGAGAIGPGDPSVADTLFDWFDITYSFAIEWVDRCITTVGRQHVFFPFWVKKGPRYHDILLDAYHMWREVKRVEWCV